MLNIQRMIREQIVIWFSFNFFYFKVFYYAESLEMYLLFIRKHGEILQILFLTWKILSKCSENIYKKNGHLVAGNLTEPRRGRAVCRSNKGVDGLSCMKRQQFFIRFFIFRFYFYISLSYNILNISNVCMYNNFSHFKTYSNCKEC